MIVLWRLGPPLIPTGLPACATAALPQDQPTCSSRSARLVLLITRANPLTIARCDPSTTAAPVWHFPPGRRQSSRFNAGRSLSRRREPRRLADAEHDSHGQERAER